MIQRLECGCVVDVIDDDCAISVAYCQAHAFFNTCRHPDYQTPVIKEKKQ